MEDTRSYDVYDCLTEQEKECWQAMESWTYANDFEKPSHLWESPENPGPRFLDLSIEEWAKLADTAPTVVRLCLMDGPVSRWHGNRVSPCGEPQSQEEFLQEVAELIATAKPDTEGLDAFKRQLASEIDQGATPNDTRH